MAGARTKPRTKRYALTAVLVKEEGGFVVTVAQLPGVVTQADTEREAVANITEAATGALEVYAETGESIPWAEPEAAGDAAESADKCIAFTAE